MEVSSLKRVDCRGMVTVPPDPIGISVEEFNELRNLTKRWRYDAKAIFGTNGDEVWASTRSGRTPLSEREPIENIPYVLHQLKKSLHRRRMEGGRLFVNEDGAYWKQGSPGNIHKIQFVTWRWKGDPPIRKDIPERTIRTLSELRAFVAKNRASKE